jgi:hypothetical protein
MTVPAAAGSPWRTAPVRHAKRASTPRRPRPDDGLRSPSTVPSRGERSRGNPHGAPALSRTRRGPAVVDDTPGHCLHRPLLPGLQVRAGDHLVERTGHGKAEATVEVAARHGHQPGFRIGPGRRRRRLSAEQAVQDLTLTASSSSSSEACRRHSSCNRFAPVGKNSPRLTYHAHTPNSNISRRALSTSYSPALTSSSFTRRWWRPPPCTASPSPSARTPRPGGTRLRLPRECRCRRRSRRAQVAGHRPGGRRGDVGPGDLREDPAALQPEPYESGCDQREARRLHEVCVALRAASGAYAVRCTGLISKAPHTFRW